MFHRPTVDDVEQALFKGHATRGRRLALELLGRDTQQAVLWFLLATANQSLRRWHEVVWAATQSIDTATWEDKSAPAFLRILAHIELGQLEQASRRRAFFQGTDQRQSASLG